MIDVIDRGVGMATDEIARLFDRFHEGRRAREQKSGLGLGLYITRGLVRAHGGRVQIESKPGAGSTFSVWFPTESA